MAYTLANTRASYLKAWENMEIKPHILPAAQASARKIIAHKNRYVPLQIKTGIPWYFIGLLHMRESNFNFATHLHNGDPLADKKTGKWKRTVNVPPNRPRKPPENGKNYTFEESAIDALVYEFGHIKEWSIEQIAFLQETYNGFGYRSRGVPSAYLWSGSNQYVKGKFIFDGPEGWRPNVVDVQLGVMVVLKCLMDLENITIGSPAPTEETPILNPEEPVPGEAPPLSPSAEVTKPTTKEMRKVSRKFNVVNWFKNLFAWATGLTTATTALDAANISATKSFLDTLKLFIQDYGIFLVIGALILGFVASHFVQEWMKQDVEDGRYTPSGEKLNEPVASD
jgi:lysozyme family protein